MFVQLIKGKVADEESLRRQDERWRTDVRPGAVGFLGSTVGITDDGTFVAIARFEDEAAAKKNAAAQRQRRGGTDRSRASGGEPASGEWGEALMRLEGGSSGAGFGQLIEWKGSHREKGEAMESREMMEQLIGRPHF